MVSHTHNKNGSLGWVGINESFGSLKKFVFEVSCMFHNWSWLWTGNCENHVGSLASPYHHYFAPHPNLWDCFSGCALFYGWMPHFIDLININIQGVHCTCIYLIVCNYIPPRDVSALRPSIRIPDWTRCHGSTLYRVYIPNTMFYRGVSSFVIVCPCGV